MLRRLPKTKPDCDRDLATRPPGGAITNHLEGVLAVPRETSREVRTDAAKYSSARLLMLENRGFTTAEETDKLL